MAETEKTYTIAISGVKERVIILVIAIIFGGPGIANLVVPGFRASAFTSDDGIIMEEDLMGEINEVAANLEGARATCMKYRTTDAAAMELIRTRITKLELLMDQCLDSIK